VNRVLEVLPDFKLLKIQPRHGNPSYWLLISSPIVTVS
jgi:hypothetical protein